MLDGSQLCSPEILDVLADERVVARQVYEITVKARNAFAHGAVTRLGEDELDCVGHLVVKSVQALVGAGRHSTTKVAAYYRWKNGHELDLENWLAAENEVFNTIDRYATR